MGIEALILGPYETNCYLVHNEERGAFTVGPVGNGDRIKEVLDANRLDLKFIILTHARGDHIGTLAELIEIYSAPVYLHKEELATLYSQDMSPNSSTSLNLPERSSQLVTVEDGQGITSDQETLRFIHYPDHTPGGMSICVKPCLFIGNTLFCGSIGRTDFLGGNHPETIASCHRLTSYPADTIILPEHKPRNLAPQKRMMNPFLV